MNPLYFFITHKYVTSLIVGLLVLNVLYFTTEKMFTYPDVYCRVNAEWYEQNTCTKLVSLAGFSIGFMPPLCAIGTWAIITKYKKKEEMMINVSM